MDGLTGEAGPGDRSDGPGKPPPATPHRRPRSVYGGGEEPDPRFSLANERTALAWMRTALALSLIHI